MYGRYGESKRTFEGRWDHPDQTGARAFIDPISSRIRECAPHSWQQTLQNIYVGVAPRTEAQAVTMDLGTASSFVSLHWGMLAVLEYAVGLWVSMKEALGSMVKLSEAELSALMLKNDEAILEIANRTFRSNWRDAPKWSLELAVLRRELDESNYSTTVTKSLNVAQRLSKLPRVEGTMAIARLDAAYSFVIGHEYAHVLLGHSKGASPRTRNAVDNWMRVFGDISTPSGSQNPELMSDLVAAKLTLGREGSPRVHSKQSVQWAASRTAEGLAVALLAVHACSTMGRPFEPVGNTKHPHSRERFEFALQGINTMVAIENERVGTALAQVSGLFTLCVDVLDLADVELRRQ
jgi:hypothetical protein